MQAVPKTPANIFRALIEFIPGGGLVTKALDNYGIFDKIANWVGQQVSALGMAAGMFIDAIKTFISSLKLSDIFHLGDVWDRAKRIFTGPIDKLISFAKGLIVGIITFIKDAILMPLAKLGGGHARLGSAHRRPRPEPDHRRSRAADRRDPDRRLHEADRPGRGLGEHEEGQRDRARVGLVPGRDGGADGVRRPDPDALHHRAEVADARGHHPACRSPSRRSARSSATSSATSSAGPEGRLEPARDHLRRRQSRRARLHQEDRRGAQEHPQEPAARSSATS